MDQLQRRSKELSRKLKVLTIIPSYNNGGTILDVVTKCLNYSDQVLVINDGSTDHSYRLLEQYGDTIKVISHPKNLGKGEAIKTGFIYAKDHQFNFVLTIDSDGQHFPEDIPYLLEESNRFPNAIIMGSRNFNVENMPSKNSFGNKFSNFWFKLFTGTDLPDTQSGFRIYPVKIIDQIKLVTWKYEFEVEILVKSSWTGYPIVPTPIRVYYPPATSRVSHFRPFQDFTRISILNTILATRAFFYEIPKRNYHQWRAHGFRKSLYRLFNNPAESNVDKSKAVGFGIFMGIFPIWGYQLIVGLIICQWLKINKPIFVVAANISIPPMIPFILFISYKIGALLMHEQKSLLFQHSEFTFASIRDNLFQYLIGAVVFSIIAGFLSFLISLLVLKRISVRKLNV